MKDTIIISIFIGPTLDGPMADPDLLARCASRLLATRVAPVGTPLSELGGIYQDYQLEAGEWVEETWENEPQTPADQAEGFLDNLARALRQCNNNPPPGSALAILAGIKQEGGE